MTGLGTPPKPRRGSRRGGGKITLEHVARDAGVSAMTVSRVINGDERVSRATRDMVKAAIGRLGYVPNPAARSLASGRQCRIALLYANPSASYLSEFLVGALTEASRCDAQLVVEYCDPDCAAESLVQQLERHRVDAALLPPPMCDDNELVASLLDAGMQVVQVATGSHVSGAHTVVMDDRAAAQAITERLIGLGHRRIGYIGGSLRQAASASREQGFRQALSDARIDLDPGLVVEGDYSYFSGLRAARQLLNSADPPTAIFAANDDMAAAAIAVAHRRGLEIPRDLSVAGFDDTSIATTVWPELTTIRQPVAEMARLATRLLADAILQPSSRDLAPKHEKVEFTLVVRGSDAPPRPA